MGFYTLKTYIVEIVLRQIFNLKNSKQGVLEVFKCPEFRKQRGSWALYETQSGPKFNLQVQFFFVLYFKNCTFAPRNFEAYGKIQLRSSVRRKYFFQICYHEIPAKVDRPVCRRSAVCGGVSDFHFGG